MASVRIVKFSARHQLRAAATHALRRDAAAHRRLRPGATLGSGLAFSTRVHDGLEPTDFRAMRDVLAAYDAHKVRNGVAETRQGGMGFHAIVSVSPEWIAAAGDPHDKRNPRNRDLVVEAVNWMESWCGAGSVYCGRLDLDEEGAGVVDLFVMPVRMDGRTGKPSISASKALTELRLQHHERQSYAALQTSWAQHCQRYLDPAIERGKSKVETRAEHLEVDAFKDANSEVRRRIDAVIAAAEENAAHIRLLLAHLRRFELELGDRAILRFFEAETDGAEAVIDGLRAAPLGRS